MRGGGGGLKFDISELYNFRTYTINSNIIQKDFVYHGTIVSTGCHRWNIIHDKSKKKIQNRYRALLSTKILGYHEALHTISLLVLYLFSENLYKKVLLFKTCNKIIGSLIAVVD